MDFVLPPCFRMERRRFALHRSFSSWASSHLPIPCHLQGTAQSQQTAQSIKEAIKVRKEGMAKNNHGKPSSSSCTTPHKLLWFSTLTHDFKEFRLASIICSMSLDTKSTVWLHLHKSWPGPFQIKRSPECFACLSAAFHYTLSSNLPLSQPAFIPAHLPSFPRMQYGNHWLEMD